MTVTIYPIPPAVSARGFGGLPGGLCRKSRPSRWPGPTTPQTHCPQAAVRRSSPAGPVPETPPPPRCCPTPFTPSLPEFYEPAQRFALSRPPRPRIMVYPFIAHRCVRRFAATAPRCAGTFFAKRTPAPAAGPRSLTFEKLQNERVWPAELATPGNENTPVRPTRTRFRPPAIR